MLSVYISFEFDEATELSIGSYDGDTWFITGGLNTCEQKISIRKYSEVDTLLSGTVAGETVTGRGCWSPCNICAKEEAAKVSTVKAMRRTLL